jgi:hypothetical protein
MSYDLFISYSRRDNALGRITELKNRIKADYREFAHDELCFFFDLEDIHGMDDWRHRILQGLRESQLLLLVLSPAYLDSEYCEWEIVEYLKYEHSRAAAGQGVAPVYFVEVPGLDTPGFEQRAAAWVTQVRRRNHFDLREWNVEGEAALKRLDVRARLSDLEKTLHARITKLRRIASAPGNIPAHNPYFVGRETEMQKLHESAGLGRFGVLTAIQGMGGFGKTALAIQYACAYADFYPGGRWMIGCAGERSLAGAIRKLDCELGITLSEEEKRDDVRAARRILAVLETKAREGAAARANESDPSEPRTLLLLDNVDDAALLQPPQADLVSNRRWLHVVATTRLGGGEIGVDPERQTLVPVDELPVEDAVRMIESHQPCGCFPDEAEREAAREIAKLLGGFTLAVEVVAVYLHESSGRITCSALLERLRHEGLQGYEGAAKTTKGFVRHNEKLVGATLGPTLDLLGKEENLALAYAALLPPDTIPLPWVRKLVSEDYPELGKDAGAGYIDPWLDLVNHLIGLRLLQVVDVDPNTPPPHAPRLVRMHQLAGEVVRAREKTSMDQRRADCDKFVAERMNQVSDEWYNQSLRWEVEPLRQLAGIRIENAADAFGRVLAGAIGAVLMRLGLSADALPLLERALEARERVLGREHPDTLTSVNNLAGLLQAQGDYAKAQPLYERALEGLFKISQAMRRAHPNLQACVGNLAGCLKQLGYSDKAIRDKILALARRYGFGPGDVAG